MKTPLIKILFALCLTTSSGFAHAAESGARPPGPFGLGLVLGTITAVTGKAWIAPQHAIDFGVGFTEGSGLAVYGDFLWHLPGIFGSNTKFGRETTAFISAGGGIGNWRDSNRCGRWRCDDRKSESATGIFLRGLFGFEWYPRTTRFGVFAEAGPSLLITPSASGSIEIGVGGRYYF